MSDTNRRRRPVLRAAATKRHIPIDVGSFGTGFGILAMVGVLAACSGGAEASPPASAGAPSASAPATGPSSAAPIDPSKVACGYRKDDSGSPAKFVGLPPKKPTAVPLKAKTMTIKTNLGDIVIGLKPELTPCTVNSFAFLAKKNYFDNTVCHRLTTLETNRLGLLGCGDPLAKGDGKNKTDGEGGPGYVFNDENTGVPFTRGTVYMAQGESMNSNGSQIAISYLDSNAELTPDFTALGAISKGMDIIDKIAKGGSLIGEGQADLNGTGTNAPKIKVEVKDVVVA